MSTKGNLGHFLHVGPSPLLSPSFPRNYEKHLEKNKKDFKTTFPFHGPLTFVARKPLLPLITKPIGS